VVAVVMHMYVNAVGLLMMEIVIAQFVKNQERKIGFIMCISRDGEKELRGI